MSERDIQNQILLALSKAGCMVFRNNVGTGWQGLINKTRTGMIIIDEPRPLHAGLCVGSSDIIGICRGRFLAVEVKTKTGRVTKEQQAFIDAVKKAGGIAGVCRSVDDALELIS